MALITAGAVEHMVISPIPVRPGLRWPAESHGNRLHFEALPDVGKLEGLPVVGNAVNVFLAESVAHALIHAAFHLALEVLPMEDGARIDGGGSLHHADLAAFRVDLQFDHLNVEHIGDKASPWPVSGSRVILPGFFLIPLYRVGLPALTRPA